MKKVLVQKCLFFKLETILLHLSRYIYIYINYLSLWETKYQYNQKNVEINKEYRELDKTFLM